MLVQSERRKTTMSRMRIQHVEDCRGQPMSRILRLGPEGYMNHQELAGRTNNPNTTHRPKVLSFVSIR